MRDNEHPQVEDQNSPQQSISDVENDDSSPQRWITGPGQPALHLFPSSEIQPGVSAQLGGHPWAPEGWEWPRNAEGEALSFLASIDLQSVASYLSAPWLPQSGMLLFFYDVNKQPWGFDPKEQLGWRVEYFGIEQVLTPHETVPGATETSSTNVGFCLIETYRVNNPETVDLDDKQLDELMEFIEMRHYQGFPTHQMLGHANPIQSPDMEAECQLASHGLFAGNPIAFEGETGQRLLLQEDLHDWVLLAQFDSDEERGWMWGDAGRLYFWVKASQAQQGRFDKAWVVLQSH